MAQDVLAALEAALDRARERAPDGPAGARKPFTGEELIRIARARREMRERLYALA